METLGWVELMVIHGLKETSSPWGLEEDWMDMYHLLAWSAVTSRSSVVPAFSTCGVCVRERGGREGGGKEGGGGREGGGRGGREGE